MESGYLRYYKREKVTVECEIITPMFLGGPDQSAQWRGAPFKALLRKWWRIAHGASLSSRELYERESLIFGAAGEKGSNLGKSRVIITLQGDTKASVDDIPSLSPVNHPEKGNIQPLQYLAGMSLMKSEKFFSKEAGRKIDKVQVKHSYFKPGAQFTLTIEAGQRELEELRPVFRLIQDFGTIGGRSRNGWGSFTFPVGEEYLENPRTYPWDKGFDRDYPSLLGQDKTGELIWKTTPPKNKWEEVMCDLAKAYIAVRAKPVGKDDKLNPGARSAPNERHLLGIPLTNHTVFGNSARHASPLHFKVIKSGNRYEGVILHLPHRHSDQQPIFAGNSQKQIKVWEKVHRKLDAISSLQRTTMAGLLK